MEQAILKHCIPTGYVASGAKYLGNLLVDTVSVTLKTVSVKAVVKLSDLPHPGSHNSEPGENRLCAARVGNAMRCSF